MKSILRYSLISAAIGVLAAPFTCSAAPLYPVDGYTLGYEPETFPDFVGGPDIPPLSVLSINPFVGAGEKTVLIFDVSQTQQSSAPEYLNFFIEPLDYPNFDTIHIDAFDAPVLRDPSYYFDTIDEIATFSAYSPNPPITPDFLGFKESIDVTSAVNEAIADGDTYLGLELYGTLGDGSSYISRYYMFGGYAPDLYIGGLPFDYTPAPVSDSTNSGVLLAVSVLGFLLSDLYAKSQRAILCAPPTPGEI